MDHAMAWGLSTYDWDLSLTVITRVMPRLLQSACLIYCGSHCTANILVDGVHSNWPMVSPIYQPSEGNTCTMIFARQWLQPRYNAFFLSEVSTDSCATHIASCLLDLFSSNHIAMLMPLPNKQNGERSAVRLCDATGEPSHSHGALHLPTCLPCNGVSIAIRFYL